MFLTCDNGLISAIFLRNLCVQKPKPVRSLRNLCVTIDQCAIHRYPICSTRYSVMCKVYTGYCSTSESVCAPVRSIIPSLKLGDYFSVQAHKPCSISHLIRRCVMKVCQTDNISARTCIFEAAEIL